MLGAWRDPLTWLVVVLWATILIYATFAPL